VLAAKLSWRPARFLFAAIRATRCQLVFDGIGNALRISLAEMANSCRLAFHFLSANVSAQAIRGRFELTILVA
jgi:hypothetical protein